MGSTAGCRSIRIAVVGHHPRIHASGLFFGLVTPTTLGSDACRALYLVVRRARLSSAVSVLLLDRLEGLAALAAFLVRDVILPSGAGRAIVAGGTAAGMPLLLRLSVGISTALVGGPIVVASGMALTPARVAGVPRPGTP